MSLKSQLVGPLEVAFAWRQRLTPNSSPSEVRLNTMSDPAILGELSTESVTPMSWG
jgi:hypothetical protein